MGPSARSLLDLYHLHNWQVGRLRSLENACGIRHRAGRLRHREAPLAHPTVIKVAEKYRKSQHAKSGEDGEQTPRAILAAPSN